MAETPTPPSPPAPGSGKIIWPNLITVVSAGILLGAETLGVGFAFGWAIAGWFGFGDLPTRIIEGICVLIGAWAIWWFVRRGFSVEPWRA